MQASNPAANECPACGSPATRCLGPLPEPSAGGDRFAAGIMPPASLFECPVCTLRFRVPIPQTTTILSQYERLEADEHWPATIRPIWHVIRTLAEAAPTRAVLDVGAFRGDFLDWLGPSWDRYAIEPSASAQRTARDRGIKVLGASVNDPTVQLPGLGVIVLIDVIEHLSHPLDVLQRLAAALVDGGRLIVLTGDTQAWAWRLSGRRYWYSALPEHLVFFSEAWFRWAAPRMQCVVGRRSRHSHAPAPRGRRVIEALLSLSHLAVRRLAEIRGLRRGVEAVPFLKRFERHDVAWWTSANDHLLIELVKSGTTVSHSPGLARSD